MKCEPTNKQLSELQTAQALWWAGFQLQKIYLTLLKDKVERV